MNYEVEQKIAAFFEKTTTTRSVWDNYASKHFGGTVIPVKVQGVCSYTVYAGPNTELVVQYRLKSLALNMDTMNLVKTIYGTLTPQISFKGQLGEYHETEEPLYIYVMSRMPGVLQLDFILAHIGDFPENSLEFSQWRQNLVADNAKFFALSWKGSQDVDQTYRENLSHQYQRDLNSLLASLPI
ncbi:unnamed protein product [Penicillium salamii]|nr:unnamed protein product [Penicillium salamii]CAG8357299.1 unnamed protein product [Penicillium salamii]